MLEKYYNMGRWDRLIRFVFGWALVIVGVLHVEIIGDPLLHKLVVIFGSMNIISSLIKVCPAYLLVKASTIRKTEQKSDNHLLESIHDAESIETDDNYTLRRKLQVSVVLPMLALFIIFGVLAYNLNYKYELTTITRQMDIATEMAAKQRLSVIQQNVELPKDASATELIANMAESAELFLHHNRQGRLFQPPVHKGENNEELVQVWTQNSSVLLPVSEPHARGEMTFEQQAFIWSSTRVDGTDEWFTSFIKDPENHTVAAYFLSPSFLVLIFFVMWLGIWSSTYIVKIFVDKMENNSKQLHYRTMHDSLTGLPNRQKVESIISGRLSSLYSERECVMLVMLDIIDFRVINETLGYTLGDQLLVKIGEYLQDIAPDRADVVRLGGDIFCLVAVIENQRLNATHLVDAVHEKLECTHDLDGISVAVQIRTGLSLGPVDSDKPEDLIRFADIALAQSKNQRTKDCFYQHDQDSHSIRKLALLARLRTAIEQDELTLVYQPKVDIGAQTLAGVEVLVRWHDHEYGAVSPVEFVSWAERSGLIDKLTHWVLTNAEKQCREWCDKGYVIPFAVNLSPTNLFDKKLIPLVSQLVNEGSFGNGMLELEITENALMEDPDQAAQSMRVLNAMGVKFAIDDFGTGLSSFSYLRALPVSNLKIDREFVSDTDQSDRDAVLLRSMIELGHGLGCVVTAEGVEDQETLNRLRQHSCDHVQGYYVCRPVPADDFLRWLESSDWRGYKQAA